MIQRLLEFSLRQRAVVLLARETRSLSLLLTSRSSGIAYLVGVRLTGARVPRAHLNCAKSRGHAPGNGRYGRRVTTRVLVREWPAASDAVIVAT